MKKVFSINSFFKKITVSIVISTIFFSLLIMPSFAVDMTTWDWKSYNVSFDLPEDFKVEESSGEYFTATGGAMRMEITPWKDAKLTSKDVANKAFSAQTNMTGKTRDLEQEIDLSKNGFKGYVIFSTGMIDGKSVRAALVGIINPKSPVNLYVTFKWWDNEEDNEYYDDLAQQIAKSFRVMAKPKTKKW